VTEQEVQSVQEIEVGSLLAEVDALRNAEWRLIQILCVSSPAGSELSYSFGQGLAMKSLRFHAAAGESVPSITALYSAAFLYENEIRDLFGLHIERIRADWEGHVLDVASDKPFDKVSVVGPRSEGGAV
jgi:ech hydrogenase subunit D